ncbi:uncharacterized protein PgNI_04369 [Pyricularia grisea]|uniref:Uncharacterized protein n=1 Tax=Pyricularia grisea TaxID=148305 RepID=A0A6P8BCJ1_PYRGI|nr:uncharacterized protein PgNI_04369 [Pyricularia grisea]TLD13484.1 hypothetical protein PgNI_04369 [Pyricularia grisea]
MQSQARVVSVDRVLLTTYDTRLYYLEPRNQKHQRSAKACWCSSLRPGDHFCWRVLADNNHRVSPINFWSSFHSQFTPGCLRLWLKQFLSRQGESTMLSTPRSLHSRRLTWTDDALFSSSGLCRSTGPKNPTVFGPLFPPRGRHALFLFIRRLCV